MCLLADLSAVRGASDEAAGSMVAASSLEEGDETLLAVLVVREGLYAVVARGACDQVTGE